MGQCTCVFKPVAQCILVLQEGASARQETGRRHVASTLTAVTNCLLSHCSPCPFAFSVGRRSVTCVERAPCHLNAYQLGQRAAVIYRAACGEAFRLASLLTPGKAAHFSHLLLSHSRLSSPPSLPRLIACTTGLSHPSSSGNLLVSLAHLIWLFIHL